MQQSFGRFDRKDFHYLGYLTDPVGYGMQVASLRENIQSAHAQPSELLKWSDMITTLLDCLDAHDFDLNFDNVMSFRAALARKDVINQQRSEVCSAWSAALRQAEKVLVASPHDKVLKRESVSGTMLNDAALAATLQRVQATIADLLNKHENKDVREFELEKWARFLQREKDQKVDLLNLAWKTHTQSAKAEENIEANLEAKAMALLNDPAKKAELTGSSSGPARDVEFEVVFRQALVAAQTADGVALDVRLQIRNVWPKELLIGAAWKPEDRAQHSDRGFFEKLESFFTNLYNNVTGADREREKEQLKLIENDSRDALRMAEAHVGSYNEKIVFDVIAMAGSWSKHNQANPATKRKCATELCKKLADILSRKQSEWAATNTLHAKINGSRQRLRQCFDIICDGLNAQDGLCQKMLLHLTANLGTFFTSQCTDEVVRAIKHEKWLRDEWQMLAQMDLAIIKFLEKGQIKEALRGAFSGSEHYANVFKEFMAKHTPSKAGLSNKLRGWIVKEMEAVQTWLLVQGGKAGKLEYEMQLKTMPPDYLNLIPARMWTDLAESFDKIHNLPTLHRQLIQGIQAQWPGDSEDNLKLPSVGEVMEKLQQVVGSTDGAKQRCTACCPYCGMMCIRENFHSGKCITIHQPSGLKGEPRKGDKNDGCCEPLTCVDARKLGYRISKDNYKTTEKCDPDGWSKCFPGWECPDAGVLPAEKSVLYELRKYLFVTYQAEVAAHFGLKPWPKDDMPSVKSIAEIKGQLLAITED